MTTKTKTKLAELLTLLSEDGVSSLTTPEVIELRRELPRLLSEVGGPLPEPPAELEVVNGRVVYALTE